MNSIEVPYGSFDVLRGILVDAVLKRSTEDTKQCSRRHYEIHYTDLHWLPDATFTLIIVTHAAVMGVLHSL